MEFESAQSNTTTKLPILKLGEYEMWVIRIKQYFQSYTDAKTMVAAIETLLRYSLRLSSGWIFGGSCPQEDLNLKFLNSFPFEWNTHVVVWMNKAEIETMSINDLYNNFKIVEQSVTKSIGASSGAQNLAFMTAPSTSSTNNVNTAKPAYEVSTVTPNVNTAKQIHKDDLEEMDLKWQLSLLSIRDIGEAVASSLKGKFTKFDKASKDLDKLLGSQITDKSKKGLGYNDVPPPHPLIYNRPKNLDLSYSGLDEFKELNQRLCSEVSVSRVSKIVEFVKPKNHEKPVKKSVRYAEMYRSQTPRGNQRNWNGQKSNQLGSNFVMYNKACFICGSFNHVVWLIGKPQQDDTGFVDSRCSRHMTGNIAYLSNFKEFDRGYVTFWGSESKTSRHVKRGHDTKIPQSSGPPVKVKITVLEGSIRRHLKLKDSEGIPSLPTTEIFEQLALMGNMKRVSKGFSKMITPLFDTMLVQHQDEEPSIQTTPETSSSKITSSPSLSSHHTSISSPSTSQPPITPTEEAAPIALNHLSIVFNHLGHVERPVCYKHELMDLVTKLTDRIGVLEKDLQQTKKTYSTALTRLILRVKKDEDAAEDSSKKGRKISDIDTDPTISLVQPQQDMEYDFDVSTVEGFTTASIPVTTASASISTVSPPRVSTVEDISGAETLVYIRRSASKAKKLDEREEVTAKEAHNIDWIDPSMLRYHDLQNRPFSVAEVMKNMCMYVKNQGGYKMSHFKGMSYEEIRPIFERVCDQIQSFVPMDSEKEKGSEKKTKRRLKRAGQDVVEEPAKRQKTTEASKSVQEQPSEEPKADELSQEQLQQMILIVLEEGMYIEALKIKEDLDKLWSSVKERFNSPGLTDDKEKEL
ncbi:hypothetical protein Tco_1194267 [Tanacetum coccineum]